MIVVDGHEDLAWNMQAFGRDYLRPLQETRAREVGTATIIQNGTCLLSWDEWLAGRVAIIFATLFVSPSCKLIGPSDELSYSNAEDAHRLYWSQVTLYQQIARENADRFRLIREQADLDAVLAAWEGPDPATRRIGLVLLMEGAEGVREPGEVDLWYEAGIRMIGPAWTRTRYAGGTSDPGPFTQEGRRLLQEMARLGMILDLSHLTDEGVLEALDIYPGPLMASHSNARALLQGIRVPERHLSDDVIIRIAERDSVIGVVVANPFLKGGWTPEHGRESVTLDDVANHIDHMCQLIGDARHVGIGSDFDGGFGLEKMPTGIESVADLPRLGDTLTRRGYSTGEIEAILGDNWLRFLRRSL